MNIAIIGHGNVGGALARQWAAKGHTIQVGARNQQEERAIALGQVPNIEVTSISEAAVNSDVLLVATPAHIANDLIPQLGNLVGKIIIDATNAIRQKPEPYPTAYHAFAAVEGVKAVKGFNTTGFENMMDPVYDGVAIDLFFAGDDQEAKDTAGQLALDAGFGSWFDFGDAGKVVLLEQFALSWINLAIMQGHGRNMGFKLLRR